MLKFCLVNVDNWSMDMNYRQYENDDSYIIESEKEKFVIFKDVDKNGVMTNRLIVTSHYDHKKQTFIHDVDVDVNYTKETHEKMLELCIKHENEIKRTNKNFQISMVIL